MNVIGYIRVSREKQAVEGHSLDVQEEKLKAYCVAMDLNLVAIYSDDLTAKTLERPGLIQALQDLKEDKAGGLLIHKLDRLTRRVRDLDTLLEEYFQTKSLISVSENLDTRTASGRLVLNLLTTVAQWEREAIGERTKASLSFLKSNGVKLGRPSVWDKETENLVHLIVKTMRDAGKSYEQIARVLTTRGIVASVGSKKWYASSVHSLYRRIANEAGN